MNRKLKFCVAAIALLCAGIESAHANLLLTYNGNSAGLFTNSGTLLLNYSTTLNNPQGIATDGTNVYISDWGNGQIEMYNGSTGAFIRNVLTPPGLSGRNPFGLAWNGSNLGSFSDIGAVGQLANFDVTTSNNIVAVSNYSSGYQGLVYYAPSNEFYATTSGGGGALQAFNATTTAFNGNVNTGLGDVKGVAVSQSNQDLYVARGGDNAVTFRNGAGGALNTAYIAGLNNPIGIAYDGATSLAVARLGDDLVSFYTSGSGGGALLSSFSINNPAYLAFTSLVPEPSALTLCAVGMIGCGLFRKRKRVR